MTAKSKELRKVTALSSPGSPSAFTVQSVHGIHGCTKTMRELIPTPALPLMFIKTFLRRGHSSARVFMMLMHLKKCSLIVFLKTEFLVTIYWKAPMFVVDLRAMSSFTKNNRRVTARISSADIAGSGGIGKLEIGSCHSYPIVRGDFKEIQLQHYPAGR